MKPIWKSKYFWKVSLIVVLTGFSLFLALPLKEKIKLGLDLQGGMHLVLKVKAEETIRNTLQRFVIELKEAMDNQKLDYDSVSWEEPRSLRIRLFNPQQLPQVREIVEGYEIFEELQKEGKPDQIVFALTEKAAKDITGNAIDQALEIIRNRVDQFGVAEPAIQRSGQDNIIVQLPGIDNPERAINLIGKTALLEFKLVDEEHDLQEALSGNIPSDSEILYQKDKGRGKGTPILLKRRTLLSGDAVTSAQVNIDPQYNEPYVTLNFNKRGGRIFGRITEENIKKRLAIILDHTVYSAPVIQEKIPGGRAQITGNFTMEEARDLRIVLQAGALPAPITIEENRIVGPSLGQDSIRQGIQAAVIGTLMVMVFMILYYRLSGLIANLALILNAILLLGVLAYFRATLTLPGIAGIILTVGMAVDANVLIYERIREELRAGHTVRAAIENGFSKAFLTIFDANVTTIIAALILYAIGTGPVKGFALTLSIGIIASMFTAIFVARVIFDLRLGKQKEGRLSI